VAPLAAAVVALAVVGATVVALRPWAAADDAAQAADVAAAPLAQVEESPTPTPTPTPEPDAVFTIVAGGDVLPHDTVVRYARESGTVDFVPLMASVQPWIAGGDLAICNMEVPLAPPGTQPSGYPMFGAPTELAANLETLGWDGCSTGTNHSLDRGYAGVVHTLDTFDAVGLGHDGSARSQPEADTAQLYRLERAGQTITVAQIGATWGTNGIPIPADAPWAVDLLDAGRLVAQATAAREAGADLVVATLHWGVEYRAAPTDDQVALATALADSGQVDLIIGTHAHVPQPMVKVPGGPGGEGMWVAYGLGNFISNQDTHCCVAQTNTGAFMTATVVKPADGPARVTGLEWTAFPVDRLGGERVYAANDILAGATYDRLQLSLAEVEARRQRVADVMGTEATERTTPPVPTGPEPAVIPQVG
jgi:poly-gamma-glutamate capsule biosynthesis protein CapA/YwtB (metallophosphatase superfamily)